jgi:hypothetical protein
MERAVAMPRQKATRDLVKGLDHKQRFDANKGLGIEAVRVTTDKEDVTAAAAAVQSYYLQAVRQVRTSLWSMFQVTPRQVLPAAK